VYKKIIVKPLQLAQVTDNTRRLGEVAAFTEIAVGMELAISPSCVTTAAISQNRLL
jgi:hypothetical protein